MQNSRFNILLCSLCGKVFRRNATGWKQRFWKREAKNNTIVKYAGKNVEPTERIYVWGYAGTGALGVPHFLNPPDNRNILWKRRTPTRMLFWDRAKLKVQSIGCGYGFSLFVTSKDKKCHLYGTGINTDSQLGYQINSSGIMDYLISPRRIPLPLVEGDSKIIGVACGRAHSIVLTTEGVFSLGNNSYGQCGRPVIEDEDYRGNSVIYKIKTLPKDVKQVVCGQDHTVFITESGHVYSCGLGTDGQTGLGRVGIQSEPMRIEGDLKDEKIVQVSGHADSILAVSDKGDLFGWGNCEYNQVGNSVTFSDKPSHLPFPDKVRHVAAAGSMSSLVTEAGDVYVWGYGVLGKGPVAEESDYPSLIPATFFGKNEMNADSKVIGVYCGMHHFAALTDDGDLYSWGCNKNGTLGLGHSNTQYFPLKISIPGRVKSVVCGVDHMTAIASSYC